MNPSKAHMLVLRSKPAVSLNERFSHLLTEPAVRPKDLTLGPVRKPGGHLTFDPVRQQQQQTDGRKVFVKPETDTHTITPAQSTPWQKPLAWSMQKKKKRFRLKQKNKQRSSVWSRLGMPQYHGLGMTQRFSSSKPNKGFWSFRNKYRQRQRHTCICMRQGGMGFTQRGFKTKRNIHRLSAGLNTAPGLHLQRGVTSWATWKKRRGLKKRPPPTRKQLDRQLDDYMSMSKSSLDRQLDEYMSQSRRGLDRQIDQYMAMAAHTHTQSHTEDEWLDL